MNVAEMLVDRRTRATACEIGLIGWYVLDPRAVPSRTIPVTEACAFVLDAIAAGWPIKWATGPSATSGARSPRATEKHCWPSLGSPRK